jgi:hypothetical protein
MKMKVSKGEERRREERRGEERIGTGWISQISGIRRHVIGYTHLRGICRVCAGASQGDICRRR